MISLPDDLPDDPILLKQMLLESYSVRVREQEVKEAYAALIVVELLAGDAKVTRWLNGG